MTGRTVQEHLAQQRLGFGTAGLSVSRPIAVADAQAVVHAALDAGVRFLDTAACYTPDHRAVGHNEQLVGAALRSWDGNADDVLVATKCGTTRIGTTADYGADLFSCGCRRCLVQDCDTSLRALGVDRIPLLQLHNPDPWIPIEESVQVLAELRAAGKIEAIGLSNVSVDQLDRAVGTAEIVSVQARLNPTDLATLDLVAACARAGVVFLAYSPLGGLGGAARRLAASSVEFAAVATARGVSVQQVILAWVRTLGREVVPMVGARRAETVRDSAESAGLVLAAAEVGALDGAVQRGPAH